MRARPIKTTMRCHRTPARMAVIHKSTTSAGEDAEGRGTSCAVGGNAHSGKEYGVSPQIKNGTAL